MTLTAVSEQCITYLENFYTEKTLISSQGTNQDIESEIKQHLQLVSKYYFKVFSFLIYIQESSLMYLKNRKHVPCFCQVIKTLSGSLGEQEMLWEHKLQASVSTVFQSSPKLS